MRKCSTGFQVKVLKFCYRHHYRPVAIVGPSDVIMSNLKSHESYSVILIDNESRELPTDELEYSEFKNKLQTFLVSMPKDAWMLRNIVQDLKTSQWWNHMASFLIIENPTSSDQRHQGCREALTTLIMVWDMNILNAKFICHRESTGLLIFSYNPYNNQAPIPWQLVKPNVPIWNLWTLAVRSDHQDSQKFCKDLDFDQTKNLAGYEIQVGVFRQKINETQFAEFEYESKFDNIMERYVFHALNLRKKICIAKSFDELSRQIFSQSVDISLNPFLIHEYNDAPTTYPHFHVELAFITQHRGNLSQIEKLLHLIDRYSRYGVVIVCFITFIISKFFLRQSVTSAILTIVRLICNAAVPNLPNIVATRVYFSGLFIFVMTLQGIYQGKLASLLTKPVALPNARTVDDLENFNYTIYGDETVEMFLKERNYSGSFVLIKDGCVKYVLSDDSAACIATRNSLINSAYMNDLYLSDPLILYYLTYVVRADWPLQERFDLLLSRLFESNIIERDLWEDSKLISRKQKFYEKEKENQGPRIIALKDLAFAFAILGIGLAGATVVFFIEFWKGRK